MLASPRSFIYSDNKRDILVESVAPPGIMLSRIQGKLVKHLRKCKKLLEGSKLRGEDFVMPNIRGPLDMNDISSAIRIQHHGQTLLLGGDVLTRNWNVILESESEPADSILLSHHGSYTGFPKQYWGKGFCKVGAMALVSGRGRHQPSPSVVRFLKKNGSEVHCTAATSTITSHTLYRYTRVFHHGRPVSKPMDGQHLVLSLGRSGLGFRAIPSH